MSTRTRSRAAQPRRRRTPAPPAATVTLDTFLRGLDLARCRKLLKQARRAGSDEREITRAFRELYAGEYGNHPGVDVLIDRSTAEPVETAGRIPELLQEEGVSADADAGKKVFSLLDGKWRQLYDMPVTPEQHTPATLWIAAEKLPVEICMARYQTPFWIALSAARGVELVGGLTVHELRRTDVAPAPVENAVQLTFDGTASSGDVP